jgi:hypothetical protein
MTTKLIILCLLSISLKRQNGTVLQLNHSLFQCGIYLTIINTYVRRKILSYQKPVFTTIHSLCFWCKGQYTVAIKTYNSLEA